MDYDKLIGKFIEDSSGRAYGPKIGSGYYAGRGAGTTSAAYRMFFDSDVLYSYGYHWPLAVRLPAGSPTTFLVNGDNGTVTTNSHSRGLQQRLKGLSVTVSVSALRPVLGRYAFDDFKDGTAKVIAVREDGRQHFYEDSGDAWREPPSIEDGWTVVAQGGKIEDGDRYWHAHRAGGVVFEYQSEHYLTGMDEGSYFVCRLRRKAVSVQDALDSLMPQVIRDWVATEQEGSVNKLQRQGEWYFIPRPLLDEKQLTLVNKPLKERRLEETPANRFPKGNAHYVTRLGLLGDRVFAKGFVRHSGGDHHPLKLGHVWHEVVHNETTGGWNAEGRVD